MNYLRSYNLLICKAQKEERRKSKLGIYYERHHIVPRSLDGTNESTNLVLLTAKEHYVAHHLLWKAYRSLPTARAFFAMQMGNFERQEHISLTAKQYNNLKEITKQICVLNGKRLGELSTPEERLLRSKKAQSALTPQQRSENGRNSVTPKQRQQLGLVNITKLNASLTVEEKTFKSRKAGLASQASLSKEERSAKIKLTNARMTPEARSERSRKAMESRRLNKLSLIIEF